MGPKKKKEKKIFESLKFKSEDSITMKHRCNDDLTKYL